jgi:hypothetical protein
MTWILLSYTDKNAYETAKASFGLQKSSCRSSKLALKGSK